MNPRSSPTTVYSNYDRTCVLVAHESPSGARRLCDRLRSAGMKAMALGASTLMVSQLSEQAPDAVLIAATSPRAREDAIALAKALRRYPNRPGILFLTSGGCAPGDLCLGDDYAHENCPVTELALRVEVLKARRSATGAQASTMYASGLRVDPQSRRVLLHGRQVRLTATEFDILHLLVAHAGLVVSKREILDHVWHHAFDGESNIVETYICTLRRKLGDSGRTLISTVRGIGYLLATEAPAGPALGARRSHPEPVQPGSGRSESLHFSLKVSAPPSAEVNVSPPGHRTVTVPLLEGSGTLR